MKLKSKNNMQHTYKPRTSRAGDHPMESKNNTALSHVTIPFCSKFESNRETSVDRNSICYTGLIIPLPKNGNLQLMTNYRGITLMMIAAKVYNKVFLNHIRNPTDKILRKNQAGFRPLDQVKAAHSRYTFYST